MARITQIGPKVMDLNKEDVNMDEESILATAKEISDFSEVITEETNWIPDSENAKNFPEAVAAIPEDTTVILYYGTESPIETMVGSDTQDLDTDIMDVDTEYSDSDPDSTTHKIMKPNEAVVVPGYSETILVETQGSIETLLQTPGSLEAVPEPPGPIESLLDTPGPTLETPGPTETLLERDSPELPGSTLETPGPTETLLERDSPELPGSTLETPGSIETLLETGSIQAVSDAPGPIDSTLDSPGPTPEQAEAILDAPDSVDALQGPPEPDTTAESNIADSTAATLVVETPDSEAVKEIAPDTDEAMVTSTSNLEQDQAKDLEDSITKTPDNSKQPSPDLRWGSNRLRVRRTMRITEHLNKKTRNGKSPGTPQKVSPPAAAASNTKTVVVLNRKSGRPTKRTSVYPNVEEPRNITRRESLRNRSKNLGTKVSKQKHDKYKWKLRGRPKRKTSEISYAESENEDEENKSGEEEKSDKEDQEEIILNPNVNYDHIKKVEEENKFQCTICEKKFRNESSKIIHEYCKLNEKFFKCEYCRQEELGKVEYETHLKKHTGKCHFVCHVCGEWFLKRSKWTFHVLLHEGRSHFPCKPCKKRFPYYQRKIHIRMHCGEQQFTCQKCKENFIEIVNENETLDEGNQPAGICTFCGEKFKTKFKYYTHIFTESKCHYSCEVCSSKFAKKKHQFKCMKCKIPFTRRAVLESHKKCYHPKPSLPKKKVHRIKKSKRATAELNNQSETTENQETTSENPTNDNTEPDAVEETPPLEVEPVGEPIEPVYSVKIKVNKMIFIFELSVCTDEKWQQTNPNNTEFTLDNDFCCQCHSSFKESKSKSYSVNTACGHLICDSCFLSDNDDECFLCLDTTDHFELKHLTIEEKTELVPHAINLLKKLTSKRYKDDEPDLSIDGNDNVNNPGPVVLACTRSPAEKSVSEISIQFP